MPPRLLLVLVLLAAGAVGWLLLGGGDDTGDARDDGTLAFERADEEGTLRGAKGPGLAADGRPRTKEARDDAKQAAPTRIGEPRPERVKVPLRGVIRGADGRPVAGARVTVYGPDGEPIELVTDASGAFTFRGTPGRYRVLVDGGADGVAWLSAALLAGGSEALPLEAQLKTPGVARITVRGTTGVVAGATVTLEPSQRDEALAGLPAREAQSTPDGIATFEDVVPGQYVARTKTAEGATYAAGVEVFPGVPTDAQLNLLPTRQVRGTVKRADNGATVAGASLHLRIALDHDGGIAEHLWTTDYAGSFDVHVPRGFPLSLHVSADRFAPVLLPRDRMPPTFVAAFRGGVTEPAALEVVIGEGSTLFGVIRGEDGAPAPDIELAAFQRTIDPTDVPLQTVRTDAEGRYRFDHLPAGFVHLEVVTPGLRLTSTRAAAQMPTTGERELDLKLAKSVRLQGRVIDAAAKPVAGARVWIQNSMKDPWAPVESIQREEVLAEAFTDDRGWWRLDNVSAWGPLYVRATQGVLASKPIVTTDRHRSGEPLTLVLEGTSGLRGTLLDEASSEPIAGATVVLLEELDGSGRVHTTTSNAEGVFEAKGLTPGMWRVYARAAGYVVPSAPLIDVGTETPVALELRLDRGLVFEGVVVDAEDLPHEGARVNITWRSGRAQPPNEGTTFAVTDASGRFRVTGFPPGTYAIHAMLPSSGERTTLVVRAARSDLRLELPRPKEAK